MEEQQLTENIIKKVALRFFRHYYKFRLRHEDQPVVAQYDLEGVGGIVADGFYSFKKPDGKTFTATFEATSKVSSDEVSFKPDQRMLLWDGIAVASFVTVLVAFLNYKLNFHILDNTRIGERLGLMLIVAGLAFGIFYLIARNFRRYRYIYAVEQFKKYFADEQWIALAADALEDKNPRFMWELKRQCTFNGVGLLTVDKNLDPKIVITPSRHDIFAGKRQRIEFMSQKQAFDMDKKGKIELLPSLFGLVSKKDKTVLRFRKSTTTQVSIVVGSLALLAVIFAKEMENPNFRVVEKEEYTQKIAKSKSNNLPEPEAFSTEDQTEVKSKKTRTDDSFWSLRNSTETTPIPAESALAENTSRSAGEEEFTERGGGEIIYDCSRFYNFDGKKYIVEVGEISEFKLATATVKAIRDRGIFSAALLKTCFTEDKKGYLVYAGEIYNSAEEASKEMDGWVSKKRLTKNEVRNWKIRAIEPIIK